MGNLRIKPINNLAVFTAGNKRSTTQGSYELLSAIFRHPVCFREQQLGYDSSYESWKNKHLKKGVVMKIAQPKNVNINDLDTLQVIWHLVYRHRVVLLITSNIVTLLIWGMQQAPVIMQGLR